MRPFHIFSIIPVTLEMADVAMVRNADNEGGTHRMLRLSGMMRNSRIPAFTLFQSSDGNVV